MEQGVRNRPGLDPAPIWDGCNPSKLWKRKRREILLWAQDSDLPGPKQGVRLFRGLVGVAADIGETIPDETLQGKESVLQIVAHFDELYKGFMVIAEDDTFDLAIYSGIRRNDETFIQFASRKQSEFQRYEIDEGAKLPTKTKGKIMMRHAKLSREQRQKLETWLKGERSDHEVVTALCQLDMDQEVSTASRHNYLVGDVVHSSFYGGADSRSSADTPYTGPDAVYSGLHGSELSSP